MDTVITSVPTAPRARLRLGYGAVVLILTLLVPTLLVLGATRLLLTEAYLQFEYNKADFPPDHFGFTQLDRLYYGRFAIRYLMNGADSSYLGDLTFADGRPLYNARELEHMMDVKLVLQAAMWALLIGGVLFVAMAALLVRSPAGRDALRWGLMNGAALLLVVLGGLVVYVVLAWDHFFDTFHGLFFSEGSWTFDFSDTLIRLFPIRFWQDAAITVGVISAAGAIVVLILTSRWKGRAAG
jgi:integral membrane protein (TIGR01906 family)